MSLKYRVKVFSIPDLFLTMLQRAVTLAPISIRLVGVREADGVIQQGGGLEMRFFF